MPLSIAPKIVTFTGTETTAQHKSRRDQVENAAAATGGVGAGVAATRGGGGALKFFRTSAETVNKASVTANRATHALETPVRQTNSLWNAFKLNGKSIGKQIAEWAEASKMPKFMKVLFTGQFGKALGLGAAVFVFITGVGEVISTLMNNLYKVGATLSSPSGISDR
ncbi:hypothetical protein IKP85_04260 [bacterium]|nr:hypothetical protein [bacterium]